MGRTADAGNGSIKKKSSKTRRWRSKKSVAKPTSKARRALQVRNNPPASENEKTCIKSDPMPEGFVFVPKGDPYITRNCKCRSKDAASIVYIVYDTKGRTQLGIRVQNDIYHEVTKSASQTAGNRAAAVKVRDARDQRKAKQVLEETFPGMPDQCVTEILQHAFLKGSGRVGRISTRSEEAKATLATEAHIRHEHTVYEQLLSKGIGRETARDAVWDAVQTLRDQWTEKSG